ncbi:MAG: DUF371 domain-containing protein [Thaumarchaeota archaeon]|nr:DUF371 domain-containing protein [Nitrososphaerota archaeon]
MLREVIEFYGHPNVRAWHEKTIEVTKDSNLTLEGDCIVGVRASKGCSQLAEEVKSALNDGSLVKFEIEVGSQVFGFTARGSSELTFEDEHEIVIRKSDYVSPRTLAVRADKAACDVPRKIVEILKDKNTRGLLKIYTEE